MKAMHSQHRKRQINAGAGDSPETRTHMASGFISRVELQSHRARWSFSISGAGIIRNIEGKIAF